MLGFSVAAVPLGETNYKLDIFNGEWYQTEFQATDVAV